MRYERKYINRRRGFNKRKGIGRDTAERILLIAVTAIKMREDSARVKPDGVVRGERVTLVAHRRVYRTARAHDSVGN